MLTDQARDVLAVVRVFRGGIAPHRPQPRQVRGAATTCPFAPCWKETGSGSARAKWRQSLQSVAETARTLEIEEIRERRRSIFGKSASRDRDGATGWSAGPGNGIKPNFETRFPESG
jgi:hypothetical protein